jgi:hypothetical protein
MTRSFLVGAQLLLLFALLTLALAASTAQTAPAFYWDERLDGLGVTLHPTDDCANGCWRLVSTVFEDETQSGGTHHIYFEEPHDASLSGEVSNGSQSWLIRLDKPANEPAGNHDMYAGNVYSARMHGAPSDEIRGMRMRGPTDDTAWQAHHVSYRLTWQWTVEPPEEPTVTVTVTPDGTPYFIPIVEVGDTGAPPEATRTPTATPTPTVTTTPTNGMPFNGSIVQTFVNCGLTQVFGVVHDANGTPLRDVRVRLTWDAANAQTFYTYSGLYERPETDASGWEFFLNSQPVANEWHVAVVDNEGNLLSQELRVSTDGHCQPDARNIIKVRFVRAP